MYHFFAFLFIFCVAITFLMNVIYYIIVAAMNVVHLIKYKKLPCCTLEDIKAPPSWEDW